MSLPLLWRKALRDFGAMGLRNLLTFAVLAAGVAVYAGGFLAQRSILSSRDYYYDTLELADLQLTFEPADLEELPPWILGLTRGSALEAASLGATAGVARFISPGAIELGGDRPVMSLEVHVDPALPLTVNDVEVVAGRWLLKGSNHEVVVEETAAELNGIQVGQELTLDPYNAAEKVKVVGLGRSAEYLLPTANPDILLPAKGSLIVMFRSIDRFVDTFGAPMFNNVSLRLRGAGATGADKQRFIDAMAPLRLRNIIDRDGQFSHRFLEEDVKAFGIFVPVVSGLFGVVTAMVLLLSMARLISQEQREIGALMALGRRAGEIVGAYAVAALVWGGGAALLGGLLAPVVGHYLAGAYGHAIGLPPIRDVMDLGPIAQSAGLGLGVALLAVLIPTLRLARLQPVVAMRGQREVAFTGMPRPLELLLRLTGSTALRFGLRNVLRRPRLTFAVISLIALSLAMSLAFRFTHVAWENYAEYAFAHERWDAIVAFKVPLQPKDTDAVHATAGLSKVEPFVAGFASICDVTDGSPGGSDVCLDHRVVGIAAADSLRAFRFVEGERFTTDDQPAIILNRNFNRVRPYHVGEEVELRLSGRKERVKVVGLTSDMTIGLGYIPVSVARRLLDLPTQTTGFLATFSEPPRQVKKHLFAHEMVNYVSLKLELQETVVQYMETIWSIIRAATVISMVLAALFMLTGMSMAVLERAAEYGTMRTYGFDSGDISRMVGIEVAVEAVTASLLAVPLSVALAAYLRLAMAEAWFAIAFTYPAAEFVGVLVPGILALPLAALPPLLQVLRASPAATIRARGIG